MTPGAIRKLCLGFPGATESIQWGGERVFKVGGKMFAVIGAERTADAMSFKASDESFRLLTTLPGLVPAPYLARARWVKFERADALPAAETRALIARSHALIAAKLPRAAREAALGTGSLKP